MALADYEYKKLGTRAVGKDIPFSVATAIALEEQVVIEKPVSKILYANVRSLFRNFYSSYEKDTVPLRLTLMTSFMKEITDMSAYLEQVGITFITYYPSYAGLHKMFKGATVRVPTTPAQSIYSSLETDACDVLVKAKLVDIQCRVKIPGNGSSKVMMLTHYPIDLLSNYNFGELMLLESNTGTLKPFNQWNTKLTIDEANRSRLGFNMMTIQLFGDKSKHFKSSNIKLKRAVMQLAKDKKWSPYTTPLKMKSDIKILEENFRVILYQMLNTSII